ncbi:hypothetical protein E2K93_12850 [Thalassotalea sp. HSM 43]|uniref:YfcL family protein n=1 Tax=Thalassotalea sp. HSM 43 TaxID=2552945 RepID=UPI00108130B6|nr:YfcL family protein [Thalassotalea sp. HSM 43]QBY05213.1 hypothetical protein E2K93_12850 [Thalassotalea sp. HSM 43]
MLLENVNTLEQLSQYFDSIVELENDDLLFASSYLRGFIEVAAVDFGDDEQPLSERLAQKVSEQLQIARSELNPNDQQIVSHFWQTLQPAFA